MAQLGNSKSGIGARDMHRSQQDLAKAPRSSVAYNQCSGGPRCSAILRRENGRISLPLLPFQQIYTHTKKKNHSFQQGYTQSRATDTEPWAMSATCCTAPVSPWDGNPQEQASPPQLPSASFL